MLGCMLCHIAFAAARRLLGASMLACARVHGRVFRFGMLDYMFLQEQM
jgi:hypothetical protein